MKHIIRLNAGKKQNCFLNFSLMTFLNIDLCFSFRNRAYNMKNQFWAVGWAGLLKKSFGQIMSNFWAHFLKFSWVKNQSKFSMNIL